MKNLCDFFFKDGVTTTFGGWVAILLAIASIVLVVGLRINNIFGWFVLIVSGIVIFVFGLAGRAEAIGLKPFTNDPLGWRSAKKSYKNAESESED